MASQPTPDERRFRALASSSVEHVAEIDSRGRVVYVSPDPHLRDPVDAIGLDKIHPEDRPGVAAALSEVLRGGTSRRLSFRVTGPQGGTHWLESTMTPFVAEGEDLHVLIVSRDTTEARQMEDNLRETRERFRRVAENAYDLISEHDSAGNMLYCNARVWEVLGYGESDPRLAPRDYIHPQDRDQLLEAIQRVRDGLVDSARVEHRVARSDGTWCWIESTLLATDARDGDRQILSIGRDVTERVEAEELLRDSERRYRDLIEKAPLGIVVVQGERFVFANASAAAMCGGQGTEDLVGREMQELLPREGVRELLDAMARAQRGETRPNAFDMRVMGLDGRERHLLGVGALAIWNGEPAFHAMMRDVSELEQSRRDQERLTLQLQEARKLESLGVLAGGIAHDFNNLLAVILSNVRYAKVTDASPLDRIEALCDAEEATESAARLVRQLLDYAGRRKPEVRSVDLSELARSMSGLLSTALPVSVELHLEIADRPLPVHADVVQLEQVLMNLVLNAAEAVGRGPGSVTVRTGLRVLGEEALSGWLGGENGPGPYACLEVEDTGVGMDAETRARIFEPFFTTKQEGHGLGLSAVLGLVQGHHGAIDVKSAPQRGTRFTVGLPIDPAEVRDVTDRPRRPLVVVADPENGRSRASCVAIRDRGLEALGAADDAEVIDVCDRHGEELAAAVVDARSGAGEARRLVRALRSRRPDLPILVLLGPEETSDRAWAEAGFAVLHAPFTLSKLCTHLEALVEKPAPAA